MSTYWTIRGGYSSVWMNRAAYSLIFGFSTQITLLCRYFYSLLSYASRKGSNRIHHRTRQAWQFVSFSDVGKPDANHQEGEGFQILSSFISPQGRVYSASTLQASLTWFAPTNRRVSLPTLISAPTLWESKSESDLLKGALRMSQLPAGSHTSQGWGAHSQHLNWSETTLAPQ